MRYSIFAALAFIPFVLAPAPAAAANSPWCLIDSDGTWRCNYYSFEQCLASRVATEMCNVNPRASSSNIPARQQHPPMTRRLLPLTALAFAMLAIIRSPHRRKRSIPGA